MDALCDCTKDREVWRAFHVADGSPAQQLDAVFQKHPGCSRSLCRCGESFERGAVTHLNTLRHIKWVQGALGYPGFEGGACGPYASTPGKPHVQVFAVGDSDRKYVLNLATGVQFWSGAASPRAAVNNDDQMSAALLHPTDAPRLWRESLPTAAKPHGKLKKEDRLGKGCGP